jgi:hypothetical protein
MGATLETNWQMIVTVLFALLMFGLAYNGLVSWLGERKDGYTALLVVGGVLVTLAGVALIDWQAAVITLAAFAASGIPMILGDIARTISKRERALRMMRLIASVQSEEIDRDGEA